MREPWLAHLKQPQAAVEYAPLVVFQKARTNSHLPIFVCNPRASEMAVGFVFKDGQQHLDVAASCPAVAKSDNGSRTPKPNQTIYKRKLI
jgi:hypothetical protein